MWDRLLLSCRFGDLLFWALILPIIFQFGSFNDMSWSSFIFSFMSNIIICPLNLYYWSSYLTCNICIWLFFYIYILAKSPNFSRTRPTFPLATLTFWSNNSISGPSLGLVVLAIYSLKCGSHVLVFSTCYTFRLHVEHCV